MLPQARHRFLPILRNAVLTTGPLQIADQVDAVRAAVTDVTSALELETEVVLIK